MKKEIVEYLGFEDNSKNPVGRPKLADKKTKKKSLIIASISFTFVILLLIFAPTIWWPISAWILYAKSIGVLPLGNTLIWPFGVNTYTSSSKSSVLSVFKNSPWILHIFLPF